MIKILVAVTTLAAVVPCSAFAQQGGGRDQERGACSPDVKRYCAKVVDQGDLIVLACLKIIVRNYLLLAIKSWSITGNSSNPIVVPVGKTLVVFIAISLVVLIIAFAAAMIITF